MKIMLTGDAAEGITWFDASRFKIEKRELLIQGNTVSRPILTVSTPEELLDFQISAGNVEYGYIAHIELASVLRIDVKTSEVIPYVCCI